MKTQVITWITACFLAGVCTGQQSADKDGVIPEFNGYKSVTINKVEPDGIRIMHESGATKIAIEDLTDEQREKYGLTKEAAAEYRKQAAENAAVHNARQREVARTRQKASRPAADTPKYVTADQVKVMWVRKLKAPRSLDPNYHKIIKTYRQFIADIKAGKYDLDAQETAATYNRNLAINAGNVEIANTFEAELARISQAKSEAAALAQQQKQERQRQLEFLQYEAALHGINRKLTNIDNTISGW